MALQKIISSVLVGAIFLLLFVGYFHPVTAITQDLGRHIKTGQLILQSKTVPKTNLYSYTYPNFPFINHHWFSEVVFYLVFVVSGYLGLLLLGVLLIMTSFALLSWFVFKQKVSAIPFALVSLIYLSVLFERTDIRPELFSFLFLSLFLVILYSYRQHYTKFIFLLIPLQLLWTNMHIYFPIGIAVTGLFLIDAIIVYIKNPKHETRNPKQIQIIKSQKRFGHLYIYFLNLVSSFDIRISSLVLVLIGECLVTLLNPNSISGALYPTRVFQNYGYQIEENQTVFFLEQLFFKPTIIPFKLSVLLLFTSLLLTFKKSKPIDWFLAIFFSLTAFWAVRNFPLFVLGTFIACVTSVSLIWNFFFSQVRSASYKIGITIVINVILLWLCYVSLTYISAARGFGYSVDPGPNAAIEFMKKQHIKGPILNNFDIGSFIESELYPEERVFVDGRPEAYPASFFQDTYIPMLTSPLEFTKQDKKYHFNTIFFSHTDQTPWAIDFLKNLAQNNTWPIVFLNDTIVIAVKRTPHNQSIIHKYAIASTSAIPDLKKDRSLMRLSTFYQKAGWTQSELKTYEKILSINPNSCFALYNLAVLYSQQNNPSATIYSNQYQLHCR